MQDHLLQHFPLGLSDLSLDPSGTDLRSSAGFAGATNDSCLNNVLVRYALLWEGLHAPTGESG
jgi:hypothetical protein